MALHLLVSPPFFTALDCTRRIEYHGLTFLIYILKSKISAMKNQLLIKLLTLTALLFLSAPAFSHAKAVSADPGSRSVLSRSPEFITVLFNQQLEPAYSTIIVKNSKGILVTEKAAIVDSTNNKRLILTLPKLAPDKYTVSYKVLSLDGHVVESTYTFRIKKETSLAD